MGFLEWCQQDPDGVAGLGTIGHRFAAQGEVTESHLVAYSPDDFALKCAWARWPRLMSLDEVLTFMDNLRQRVGAEFVGSKYLGSSNQPE